jgi:hypothetical protein
MYKVIRVSDNFDKGDFLILQFLGESCCTFDLGRSDSEPHDPILITELPTRYTVCTAKVSKSKAVPVTGCGGL